MASSSLGVRDRPPRRDRASACRACAFDAVMADNRRRGLCRARRAAVMVPLLFAWLRPRRAPSRVLGA
jgi:hypothetical protein